jgi:outer membrane protein OmpA-like peptidoglycan-associated protein
MKNRMWISLTLAVIFFLPAYAQQGEATSTGQTLPAVQSPDQAEPQTAPPPANKNATEDSLAPLQSERHEGFWGKINPLARKKYVQRQVEPIRNRVNELDELTAANSKAIRDVDSRAQEGIRMADRHASEADQHAVDAGNRAQMAGEAAQQASTRLQAVQQAVTNFDQYQPVTQTDIRLRAGQVEISKKAKEALDQMAESVKGQNAYLFEVQGFSSGKGAQAIENSQRVAESVVRYMVLAHDIPVYRVYLLGLGNAPAAAGNGETQRTLGNRVEVTLLKNPHLAELASASTIQMPDTPAANNPQPSSERK